MKEELSPSPDANNSQYAASQGNCGPKEAEPKQTRSLNALKFGFFSPKALLPGESWPEFEEFHKRLLLELGPRNRMEAHLIEQYIAVAWRLRRLPEIEARIFTRYGISEQGNQCGPAFALVATVQSDNILGQLARYEATLRKNAFKYLEVLRSARKDKWGTDASEIIDAQTIDMSSGPSVQTHSGAKPDGSPAEPLSPAQPVSDADPEA